MSDCPLGNLVLAGLAETLGDLPAALDEAGRLRIGPRSLRSAHDRDSHFRVEVRAGAG